MPSQLADMCGTRARVFSANLSLACQKPLPIPEQEGVQPLYTENDYLDHS